MNGFFEAYTTIQLFYEIFFLHFLDVLENLLFNQEAVLGVFVLILHSQCFVIKKQQRKLGEKNNLLRLFTRIGVKTDLLLKCTIVYFV